MNINLENLLTFEQLIEKLKSISDNKGIWKIIKIKKETQGYDEYFYVELCNFEANYVIYTNVKMEI